MPSSDDNKELISRQWEVLWNQGRVDQADAFYAEEFKNFSRPMTPGHISRIVAAWRTAFPDLRCTIEEQLADGDQVFSDCTFSGTQRGPLPLAVWSTLRPSGKRFTARQSHRFRLRDNKIVEHWAVRDDLAMLDQLGHLTLPGQTRESQ